MSGEPDNPTKGRDETTSVGRDDPKRWMLGRVGPVGHEDRNKQAKQEGTVYLLASVDGCPRGVFLLLTHPF